MISNRGRDEKAAESRAIPRRRHGKSSRVPWFNGVAEMDRRAFLAGTLGLAYRREKKSASTRLILLGSGGGPRPRKASSGSSQVVVANGAAYVVDCGDGVARQLVFAGVPVSTLRHVFITHLHSDHTADYGNLIWLAWTAGLRTPVNAWGPPPLERMTKLFFEMYAVDIEARVTTEGRVPLAPLVQVHELQKGGLVLEDENLKVIAALVDHPPMVPAFAYRFNAPDRSIVISGDTKRSDNLVELARGADVLVHSALYLPALDRLVARVGGAPGLKESILSLQGTVEDAARVAEAAGVATLVLSHLIPPDDPEVTEEMWLAAARPYFRGSILVGRDLMEM
jgi:ribonuclease BN (tRNA processing enzyme)